MKVKKVPKRKCLGCNEMKDKKELVRIVRGPEGDVSLDLTGKKPGRGAYICLNKECVESALKQKQIDRALDTKINEELRNKLIEGLVNGK